VKRQSKATAKRSNRPNIAARSKQASAKVEVGAGIRRIIRGCRHCVGEIHLLLVDLLVVSGIVGALLWLVHYDLFAGRR
jgi:hypothetical protein